MKLWEEQEDCVVACRQSFMKGNKRVMVVSPTGSGKTTIFGKMVRDFIDKNEMDRAVIVSHLGLLTAQTGDRFKEEWDVNSGVLQADKFPHILDRVIISTMQSFRSKEKVEKYAKRVSYSGGISNLLIKLIIVDECQRMGSDSYDSILEMFPNAHVIGFTATPFRENKLISNMFDDVPYTISMQELIDKGRLVPPLLHHVKFDLLDEAHLFSQIVKLYKENMDGEQMVVYLKTIEQAENLRNIFVDNKVTCSAVTSKLKGKVRDELLKNYKKGDGPMVLTTVDVLTAGFDCPNLGNIIMPYKVGSVTTFLQRIGRGLRTFPNKTHCNVYVGSDSPTIESGFWEKITRQCLEAGKKEYDTYNDDLEYLKGVVDEEIYTWTKDVVAMAKEVKKHSDNIYRLINEKQFPPELLDRFVDSPPVVHGLNKAKATKQQINYLEKNNLPTGVTKQEASAIINSHQVASGFKKYDNWEIVQGGKYKGVPFEQVPKQYWNSLRWRGHKSSKDLIKSRDEYNRRIKSCQH